MERPPENAKLEKELTRLRVELLTMASMAEQNLGDSVRGLLSRNSKMLSQAIAADEDVDQLEKKVDLLSLEILTELQPKGASLRQVVSLMKMATNLERVSDEAGNIARRARKIIKNPELSETQIVEPLYQLASDLLHKSVHAFSQSEIDSARQIKQEDNAINEMHSNLVDRFRDLMEEVPERTRDFLDLIFIVRSLERVGDHATNIAEDTIYAECAEDIRHLH